MDDPKFVTSKQLTGSVQVSKRTLSRWHKAGRMPPPVRIAATVRREQDAVAKWLDRQQWADEDE